jgi:hypothetical protein
MAEKKENSEKGAGKPGDEGYGIFDLLWLAVLDIPRIMRSLKFAVWVILILAIFTLAGAILPQEKFATDPDTFAEQYVNLFHLDDTDGRLGFGEILYNGLVKPLELYHVYETGLYLALLIVLTISSALCSWDRLKIARTLAGKTSAIVGESSIKSMQYVSDGAVEGGIEDVAGKTRTLLKSRGFRIFEASDDKGSIYFFGRRNFFKHYASVGFHLAFLFIIVGGLIGHDRFLGYEGRIALSEGETSPVGSEVQAKEEADRKAESTGSETEYVPQSNDMIRLTEYENIYRESDFRGIDAETGFPLDYGGSPSDFVSHLEIYRPSGESDSGETILARKAIEVNYPLRCGGISYYQLAVDALLTFTVLQPGGGTAEVQTFLNRPFDIRAYDKDLVCIVRSVDYAGGIWEAKDGTRSGLPYVVRLVDYSDYMDRKSDAPVLLGYLTLDKPLSVLGSTISLSSVREYTILQYVHDPGVPLVYFGGLLLIIGVTITLYFPYRTVRVMLKPGKPGTTYVAGGNSSEFPAMLASSLSEGGEPNPSRPS